MGILNVTPDSFSERGTYFDRRSAIKRGLEIEREGADILDIGGESTRPGAQPVSEQEELGRVIPVIEELRRKGLRIPISIDTYKSVVAARAIEAGAEIINDVSGLRYDRKLAGVIAETKAAAVLMHVRGTPVTMQKLPRVRDIMLDIRQSLSRSVVRALLAGISRRRIVIDPGIGFGKSFEQNFEILRDLGKLRSLGYPLLVGPSRKGFIRATVASGERVADIALAAARRKHEPGVADDLLYGTAAAVTAAILNGAHIVRVHDVRKMAAVARIADALLEK